MHFFAPDEKDHESKKYWEFEIIKKYRFRDVHGFISEQKQFSGHYNYDVVTLHTSVCVQF